jgi:hypothetical protein
MIARILLVLVLVIPSLVAVDHITVPRGRMVMIDGKISGDEWIDAGQVELGGSGLLFFKTAGQYVYFAVQLPNNRSGFVDLYLAPADGKLYDLHSSAKLGQRVLSGGHWPEWNSWWNNRGWVANVSRVESFDEKKFLPETIREFQIDRSYFAGRVWKIMLEISLAKGQDYVATPFPTKADPSHPETWLRVNLP